MRWGFILPGQPPSWNESYRIAYKHRTTRDGKRVQYASLVKRDSVQRYQDDALLIIRAARPSRWAPAGQVRVLYEFYLHNDIDADNCIKAINDAIENATGVNDKEYLPCVTAKVVGVPLMNARVVVILDDGSTSSSPDPAR